MCILWVNRYRKHIEKACLNLNKSYCGTNALGNKRVLTNSDFCENFDFEKCIKRNMLGFAFQGKTATFLNSAFYAGLGISRTLGVILSRYITPGTIIVFDFIGAIFSMVMSICSWFLDRWDSSQ